ncbi:hypothetical protein CLCR_00942 [Cladophialophora carrionii]|uniref:Uncharacterized protein n=1 Tax=Cladophialophora carrionii TaxID=86049 RepID=A0A1C1D0Z1_9EURO|nr:hypothetical protein CLCR_00942 [Cladophialophora carrionii]
MPFGVEDDELGAYIALYQRRQDRLTRIKQRSLLTPAMNITSPSRCARHFMVPESAQARSPSKRGPYPMIPDSTSTSPLSTQTENQKMTQSPSARSGTAPRRPLFWPSDTPYPPPDPWWKRREEPGKSTHSVHRTRRPLVEQGQPPPPYIAAHEPPPYTEGASPPEDPVHRSWHLIEREVNVLAQPTTAASPAAGGIDRYQARSSGNHIREHTIVDKGDGQLAHTGHLERQRRAGGYKT